MVPLVGQVVQEVVQHLLPAVELAQAGKQCVPVVPVQVGPVQLVLQQSGVDIGAVLQDGKDAAGVPEGLAPQSMLSSHFLPISVFPKFRPSITAN